MEQRTAPEADVQRCGVDIARLLQAITASARSTRAAAPAELFLVDASSFRSVGTAAVGARCLTAGYVRKLAAATIEAPAMGSERGPVTLAGSALGHRCHAHVAAADPAAVSVPYTILLVDDDALVCSTTSSMLTDLGHQVHAAASGKAALEILRAGAMVDLVLTDQAMPGMTGLQLAAEIRTDWPDMPIMLTTGYADVPDRQGLDLPRLVKPYGQDEMAAAIASLMRSRSSNPAQ